MAVLACLASAFATPATYAGGASRLIRAGTEGAVSDAADLAPRNPMIESAGTPDPGAMAAPTGVPSLSVNVSAGGAATAGTTGIGTMQAGYTKLTVNSGNMPWGTAVISLRQNDAIVTETGVPASKPTTAARIFIDYRLYVLAIPSNIDAGLVNINTGMAIVNNGTATANIVYTLRHPDGGARPALSVGHSTLAAGNHFACFIDELQSKAAPDFIFPADFSTLYRFGSLDISSDQPLSILGLRGTVNQRNEYLITTIPVADLTATPADGALYFPQFVDGGGYTTSLLLMNTSNAIEEGSFEIINSDGDNFDVRQAGGDSASSFSYLMQPGAVIHFQADGSPAALKSGWVRLTPKTGTFSPACSGLFGYNPDTILVSESGIPSATVTTHAHVYVDLSSSHNTGLAVSNIRNANAVITIEAFEKDGVTPAGAGQGGISLPPNGHRDAFADQLIAGLPEGFTGILNITSPTPFAALTLRTLMNERHEFLMTTFPIADVNQRAPEPIAFPQTVDGGGYTTEFILMSSAGAGNTTLGFFNGSGEPMPIGK